MSRFMLELQSASKSSTGMSSSMGSRVDSLVFQRLVADFGASLHRDHYAIEPAEWGASSARGEGEALNIEKADESGSVTPRSEGASQVSEAGWSGTTGAA